MNAKKFADSPWHHAQPHCRRDPKQSPIIRRDFFADQHGTVIVKTDRSGIKESIERPTQEKPV